MSWSTPFDEPIRAGRKTLRTLHDARAYILKLSQKRQAEPHWQTAAKTLLLGAKHGKAQLAEIAVRTAISREEKRE